MSRHYRNWLEAFIQYSSYGEAPRHMYFWSGVSAIAGALRRRVWIDQAYFRWYPNFYICLVAPPGIVSKSTTAGVAMSLLRKVPGIKFGPDVVTWPALVSAFADAQEGFEYNGGVEVMSAMTLESSEFGNLLNPQDRQMVDLLVALWDGKPGAFQKATKNSGSDTIENPWINLIACTTPSWIADNFPEYMIGGGFTSRTIFVYADQKAQYVAYPGLAVPRDLEQTAGKLVEDLTHISLLAGEYKLSQDAVAWGEQWYRHHYTYRPANLDMDRFGGYIARKQTHIHKLALVLAASESDQPLILPHHLELAHTMITDLEPDMQFVFQKIGRSTISLYVDKLVTFVHAKGSVRMSEAYRHVHSYFPSMREFEDAVAGCIRAGYIKLQQQSGDALLIAGVPLPSAQNGAGVPKLTPR